MHEQKVQRTYNVEMYGALGIYAVMLVASIKFGRAMDAGVLRTIVLSSPMIGFMCAILPYLGKRFGMWPKEQFADAKASP